MEQRIINTGKSVAANLVDLAKFSQDKLFIDYDEEADVLYVSFGEPQKADNSIQEEGVIRRFKNKKIIGLTILNASKLKN